MRKLSIHLYLSSVQLIKSLTWEVFNHKWNVNVCTEVCIFQIANGVKNEYLVVDSFTKPSRSSFVDAVLTIIIDVSATEITFQLLLLTCNMHGLYSEDVRRLFNILHFCNPAMNLGEKSKVQYTNHLFYDILIMFWI